MDMDMETYVSREPGDTKVGRSDSGFDMALPVVGIAAIGGFIAATAVMGDN